MLNLYKSMYFMLRRKEIIRAKAIIKKISVEDVFSDISKICWKNGLSYEIILKNYENLFLKISGKRESSLFKYSKKKMIFIDEFENFIQIICGNDVDRGIYISTGVFDMEISKKYFHNSFYKKIKLVDKDHFIIDQLGAFGRSEELFSKHKLNFFKYLPY